MEDGAGEIETMINDCLSALNIPRSRGGPGFNQWEREFLESIEDAFKTYGKLTEKQYDKLHSLWSRI